MLFFITKKEHEERMNNMKEFFLYRINLEIEYRHRAGIRTENLKDTMYDLAAEFDRLGYKDSARMLRGKLIEAQLVGYNKIV